MIRTSVCVIAWRANGRVDVCGHTAGRLRAVPSAAIRQLPTQPRRGVGVRRRCRFRHATSYARLAEFFAPFDEAVRLSRYRRSRELFDVGFAGDGLVRNDVAYRDASLPAYRLPARGRSCGTVLLHGGFDSLIEEFYAIWQRIAAAGFDVITFDGPGQGGARR